MQARRGANPAEFQLFDDGEEIGYVRGAAVGFVGFKSRMDAAQAAYAAHRALARRRSESTWTAGVTEEFVLGERGEAQYVIARRGLLARLCPPDPQAERDAWGFEVALRPEEGVSVVAVSRARTMWRELGANGFARHMRQFSARQVPFDATEAAPIGAGT
ncbi:MAG: hypothetical protein ACREOF_20630 [Gemmatimonadales bacterium]